MRAITLLLLFAVVACTSTPSKSESPCAGVVDSSCGGDGPKPLLYSHHRGLGPDKTVQLMLQEPMLIGGKPADPSEWPASVYARAGSSACSATLIGDRVLFIASHCVSDGGRVSFTAHANRYQATCTNHPEYRSNQTADWTLCLVDRPVTGVPFEVMGVDRKVAVNDTLLLSGYGCVKPGGGGGNDGIFRIGNATVRGLPYGKSYDIVTKGGAALCFGDSGGSAYQTYADGHRFIVGVNSRGDISTMSYLPAVYAPSFSAWAVDWAKKNANVRICGVHSDALGCRMGQSDPQPNGKYEITEKAACARGVVAPDYLKQKEAIVESMRQALRAFQGENQ